MLEDFQDETNAGNEKSHDARCTRKGQGSKRDASATAHMHTNHMGQEGEDEDAEVDSAQIPAGCMGPGEEGEH